MDIIILGISTTCFVVYFLTHIIFLRFLKQAYLFKASFGLYGVLLLLDLWLCRFYGIAGILISVFTFSLFTIVYLLRVLGIFETSIRFKLIDFLGNKEGIRLEEILKELDSKSILDSRLKRFEDIKNIICKDGLYSLNEHNKIYLVYHFVEQKLKKLITPYKE